MLESRDQPGILFGEASTEFYVPGLQFAIRIVLGMLGAIYFYWHQVPPLVFHPAVFALMFVSYFLFHLMWWQHFQLHGMGPPGIRVANWFDLVGAVIVFANDPYPVPAMLALVFATVLGNGLQHGLKAFSELMIGAVITLSVVFPIRQYVIGEMPPYNLAFLLLLLMVSLYYVYLLIMRIENLKFQAVQRSEMDPLTGISNRRAFFRAATYLMSLHDRTRLPLVLMYGDMDHFKEVNDKYGHDTGDKVLQMFASILKENARKGDAVSRLGGDEFVLAITDMSISDARSMAMRLQQSFVNWARSQSLPVGISFGLAAFPEKPVLLDDMMRHVDGALYEAKKQKGEPGIHIAPPF